MRLNILILIFLYLRIIECHISLSRDPNILQRFTIQFRSSINEPDAVQEDHERFLRYLKQHQVFKDIQIRYNYTNVFNGMSIEVLQPALSASSNSNKKMSVLNFIDYTLSTCPYVNRYWPGKRYPRPNTISKQQLLMSLNDTHDIAHFFGNSSMDDNPLVLDMGRPNINFAHALTTVNKAKQAGWTGQGIKVGILDTGIDYTHPALGGCFGVGCKVRYGKDLVGDDFNGPNKLIQPDDDPLDQCDGHGTHIAGIIAANDTFKGFEGVAPGVTIGAWRIFGCQGDTDDDVIIAAADMAVKSGMHIINLSLGGGLGSWQEDPLAVALSNIAKNNITIVVAQGNEGKDGFARTPSPAIGKHLISVGSVDNSERFGPVIQVLDNKNETKGTFEYLILSGKGFFMDNLTLSYNTFTYNDTMKSCELLTKNNSQYNMVIVEYHQICNYTMLVDFIDKDEHSTSVLIYSNQQQTNSSMENILKETELDKLNIPIGMMGFENGQSIIKTLNTSTMKLHFTTSMIKTITGGESSDFSTWGPDPELHFKPDISAVGGYMYSTYPVKLGGYATLSGTSMATPYLSGCLALLMEATKNKDSSDLIKRLLNYAKPVLKSKNVYENPIKQGSGLVQIYDSILGKQSVIPGLIALNDTEHFLNSTNIKIVNHSNETRLFKLDYISSICIQGYNFTESSVPLLKPIDYKCNTTVLFEKDKLELKKNQTQEITVYIKPPMIDQNQHLIYGGFLKIQSTEIKTGQMELSHIPFFGSLGSQKELPILDTISGYPFLGDNFGKKLSSDNLNFNFTKGSIFDNNNMLHIYSRIGNPTAQIKYQLYNQHNKLIGDLPIGSNYYLSRNDHSKDNFDYVLEWKGEIIPTNKTLAKNNSTSNIHQQRLLNNRHLLSILNPNNIKRNDLVNVPIGDYKICITVLKIFGNPNNLKDWQNWCSPSISVIG